MSLANGTGPSPPPPPPPPRGSYLGLLPTELFLEIIQYLNCKDYTSFALGLYPLLQRHGLVPPLTTDIYNRITRQKPPPPNVAPAPWPLPLELTELTLRELEPADRIAFIFSHRDIFTRYLPELTPETRMRLWKSRERDTTTLKRKRN